MSIFNREFKVKAKGLKFPEGPINFNIDLLNIVFLPKLFKSHVSDHFCAH